MTMTELARTKTMTSSAALRLVILLSVYQTVRAESPLCTVTEEPEYGDVTSLTVSCSSNTTLVLCEFYRIKGGGNTVQINETVRYNQPGNDSVRYNQSESGSSVRYNRSEDGVSFGDNTSSCSVSVPTAVLGDGEHSIPVYIYTNDSIPELGLFVEPVFVPLNAPTITFHNHTESLPPRVGEFLNLTCSSRGFPGASSTSLRRERTNQELENVNGSQLTYFSDPLTCLDTDVYVCSSWNVWDISTQEIMVNVPCPPQFNWSASQTPVVDSVLGDTARFTLDIYGFPEPSLITLHRINDVADLASSDRHSVQYTAGLTPFGSVDVTISGVTEADFTRYMLTIVNGEGTLAYTFLLKEAENNDGGSVDGVAVGVGVAVAGVVTVVVVVVVVLVRRHAVSSGGKTINGKE